MSSLVKVLHLTGTPLVGAPAKIVAALNAHTRYRATCLIAADYPRGLAGKFVGGCMLWENTPSITRLVGELIAESEIVHIHNGLPRELCQTLAETLRSNSRCIYHLHSTVREGPLYIDREPSLGVDVHLRLTIPHFPQRAFPHHKMVPNIVTFPPTCSPIRRDQLPRVVFSPSHKRRGQRWGSKESYALTRTLDGIEALQLAEVQRFDATPFETLTEFRRKAHITVDEIATGALHQVSFEGLAAGNVVVNGADFATISSIASACRVKEAPPFVYMSEENVREEMRSLVTDKPRIARLQQASYEYFKANLLPSRLIKVFEEAYDEVLEVR